MRRSSDTEKRAWSLGGRRPTVDVRGPTVDEVDFKALYRKQTYEVATVDGWTLVVTRYRPTPQPFFQPIFGEPLLLVHGFAQNRHAWTSGQFVKNLLFFGADIHILELRGHGKSSIALQHERAEQKGGRLPADIDYGWDLDSYFLHDLPAAVAGVKQVTGRDKIFLCGHSMGGMLGYGYAGMHNDLEGLITIGASCDLGKGFFSLWCLALAEPLLANALDAALRGASLQAGMRWRLQRQLAELFGQVGWRGAAERLLPEDEEPEAKSYRYLPVDQAFRWCASIMTRENYERYKTLARFLSFLTNPSRATCEDIRWLLEHGGEAETRGAIAQFAKWIRRGEMVCYRTGYDFKRTFSRIEIPMAIIFGDMDKLASMKSTAAIYHEAKSEYLLWRPVKGNSHVELTMGHDIRQICYDVKNLVDFAVKHRASRPSLPRLDKKNRRR